MRRDRIDSAGEVTLRHRGQLYHIGVGRAHKYEPVIMLVAGLDVRILSEEGEVLEAPHPLPTKNYQAIGRSDVSTVS